MYDEFHFLNILRIYFVSSEYRKGNCQCRATSRPPIHLIRHKEGRKRFTELLVNFIEFMSNVRSFGDSKNWWSR